MNSNLYMDQLQGELDKLYSKDEQTAFVSCCDIDTDKYYFYSFHTPDGEFHLFALEVATHAVTLDGMNLS